MDQNLNQYRLFYAVAKHGSFSRAADELYISQPALSKAVSKLEEGLDTTLFLRSPRGVVLTEEGEILLEHLETAFSSIYSAEKSIKRINELGVGHIKIGASASLCKFLLIPYLKDFIKTNPHIDISILSQDTVHNLKLLETGKIDIALVVKPDNLKNISFYSLGDFEDIFVTTKQYLDNFLLRGDLSRQSPKFESELFKKANFILMDKQNVSRQYVDNYLIQNDIEIDSVLEVNNMDLLIELSKIGLGIGCVIREFVLKELNTGILEHIQITNPLKKRIIGFAYSNTTPPSNSMKTFIDFFTEK